MATRYNYTGQLITDGLVLNLDAAKRDSYPGSGTTWYDLSGNGNNGTLTNGPTYTGVSKDAAIVFDGTNDYVQFNTSTAPPNLQSGDTITIESWVKKTSTSGWQPVVTKIDSSDWILRNYELVFAGTSINLNAPANSLSFFYRNSANTNWNGYSTTTTFTDNQWHHISFTYRMSTASSAKMYVNGAMTEGLWRDGTGNDTPSTTSNVLRIGNTDPSFSEWYGGNISSTKIYNRYLSQFDVWQNFNALKGRYGIPDIVTDGLVLNLDAGNPYSYLSGSSGTTWTDVSGEGNDGTLTNGASYSNGAIVFDGTDDYVRFNSGLYGRISFSLEYWFYQNSIESFSQEMFTSDYTTSGNTSNPGIEIYSNGTTLYFRSNYNNSTRPATTTISAGVWNHVVAVCTVDSGITIYLNGVEGNSNTPTNSYITWNNDPLNLGAITNYPDPLAFNGKISNGKVYNRALTQDEITQNFNALRGRYGI